MYTELGEIKILVNGKEVPYKSVELINHSRYFSVEKRFKLICDVPKQTRGNIAGKLGAGVSQALAEHLFSEEILGGLAEGLGIGGDCNSPGRDNRK